MKIFQSFRSNFSIFPPSMENFQYKLRSLHGWAMQQLQLGQRNPCSQTRTLMSALVCTCLVNAHVAWSPIFKPSGNFNGNLPADTTHNTHTTHTAHTTHTTRTHTSSSYAEEVQTFRKTNVKGKSETKIEIFHSFVERVRRRRWMQCPPWQTLPLFPILFSLFTAPSSHFAAGSPALSVSCHIRSPSRSINVSLALSPSHTYTHTHTLLQTFCLSKNQFQVCNVFFLFRSLSLAASLFLGRSPFGAFYLDFGHTVTYKLNLPELPDSVSVVRPACLPKITAKSISDLAANLFLLFLYVVQKNWVKCVWTNWRLHINQLYC